MKHPVRINSLAQYIKTTASVRDAWIGNGDYLDPWFRGHTDAAWGLTPSLIRLDLRDHENQIRSEFIRRGAQLSSEHPPKTDWEWYFLMQHYGAPTRLLDWTSGSLVALHFALNSLPPGHQEPTCDAAVWILDPWWLNRQVIRRDTIVLPQSSYARPYLPSPFDGGAVRRRYPIAIDPPHIARRIAVQQSRFTIHGTATNGIELLGRKRGSHLQKLVIGKRAIVNIRKDLYTAGIADTTVFPDLEGLSQELTRYYTDDW